MVSKNRLYFFRLGANTLGTQFIFAYHCDLSAIISKIFGIYYSANQMIEAKTSRDLDSHCRYASRIGLDFGHSDTLS